MVGTSPVIVLTFSGESLAELYHGNAVSSPFRTVFKHWLVLYIPTLIFILSCHCNRLILQLLGIC